MKNDAKWLYLVIAAGFLLNIYFFLKVSDLRKNWQEAAGQTTSLQSLFEDYRKARLLEAEATYQHWGRILDRTGNEAIVLPQEALSEDGAVLPAPLKLVWVFTEVGCDVCRDKLTGFAREVASELGAHAVAAIVHADQRRYANAYARMNQVNFPVYFSENYQFMRRNQLRCGPVILLVDAQDRVLASHCPVSSNPEFTALFFDFCRTQLGIESGSHPEGTLASNHEGHPH